MTDYTGQKIVTVCAGISGSGKSSFVIRYFLNSGVDTFFIFDPDGEYERRLLLPACSSVEEMDAASVEGWCVFNPHAMFPGRPMEAFEFFTAYAWNRSAQLPGQKILFVDEVWKYCNPLKIPVQLMQWAVEGRKRNAGLFICAQRPNKINEAILNEMTELVCFRLQGKRALEFLPDYSLIDAEEVSNLPRLHFVAENISNGCQLRGQIVFDQKAQARP